jgi:hypothetical protein
MSALYPSNPSQMRVKRKTIDTYAAEAVAAGDFNGPSVEVPRGAQNICFKVEGITADRTTGNETYDIDIQGRQSPDGAWVDIPGLSFTQIATASPAGEQLPTAANAGNLAIPRYVRAQMTSAGTTPILTCGVYMEYMAPRGPGKVVDHGALS